MEKWLLFALMATACWGIYNFAVKILVGENFLNSNIKTAVVFIAIGLMLPFGAYFLLSSKEIFSMPNINIAILGIFLGVVWGIGTLVMLNSIISGADVSRMTPVFNLGVLITVALAIFFLHELPNKADALRIIVGALLTIIGAALVVL